MPESVLDWGVQFILSLQTLGDWLVGPMNMFTFLGNEDFYLLLFPFLYWCVDGQLGIRMGVYLILSLGINELLKAAFHDPRPYWYDAQVRLLTGAESSFGIPSGHAQNSIVIWSGLASQFRQRWAWVLAVFLAFFMGASRMYLGVHFPTDVFFGWGVGILFLILAIRFEGPVVRWIQQYRPQQKVAFYFVLSLSFILANALVIQVVNNSFSLPAVWVENASQAAPEDPIAPLSLSNVITVMASAFGFLTGVEWLNAWGGFDLRGTWAVRAGRFFIGIIGVMVIRYGLDAVFVLIADDLTPFGYVLRYIRYSTIGFWMSALAPVVFMRLNLAMKAHQ